MDIIMYVENTIIDVTMSIIPTNPGRKYPLQNIIEIADIYNRQDKQ